MFPCEEGSKYFFLTCILVRRPLLRALLSELLSILEKLLLVFRVLLWWTKGTCTLSAVLYFTLYRYTAGVWVKKVFKKLTSKKADTLKTNIARFAKRCPSNIASVFNVLSCFYLKMSLLIPSLPSPLQLSLLLASLLLPSLLLWSPV